MPNIKVKAQDGKFLTIPVDTNTDPSQYDGIVEDALQHYHGSLQPQQPLGQMDESYLQQTLKTPQTALAPIVKAGKMAYKGWEDIADVLTNPQHPLYTKTLGSLANFALSGNQGATPGGLSSQDLSKSIQTIPLVAGVPQNTMGAALSALGGASELGVTKAITSPLESAGRSVANAGLRMARMPGPAANLASENLGQFLSSDINDVKAGQALYKDAANSLGVEHLDDTLGKYGAASSAYPKAIKDYAGDKGIDVIKNGIDSSYQDLHNVVEATTEMRMRPTLYQDLGTMKDLPRNKAVAIDMMKSDALKLMQAKAGKELEEAAMAEGGTPPEADVIQQKMQAYNAAMQLPQIRKDLAIAHAAANSDTLLGSNLGGRTSELGRLETLGGLASGNPALMAYGVSRSPALMKGLIGAGYAGYQFANPQLASDFYNMYKGNQNGR